MKLTGTIVGFESSYGSIYNIAVDDTKCYAWKANVEAKEKEKMLTITFHWNGELHELKLALLKEDYYSGKLYYNGELGGEVYFCRYDKKDALILKGNIKEDDAGIYECFVELKQPNA